MKKLIFYFIVLLFSVWVGLKIAADPGYLLVDYQKVTVEMPLWVAALLLIATFILAYFLVRTISNIRSLKSRLLSWSRSRKVRRAWQRTHRGFIALLAGDWKLSEKDLTRAAPEMDTPILNYVAAAYAAQAQGLISVRDEYLGRIQPKNRLSELALGLVQAQLQLKQSQYEQALAKLQHCQQIAPKHKLVLSLLKEIYIKLEDWDALEILLPQLDKQHILSEAEFENLSRQVYRKLLANANNGASLVWSRIPKSLRSSSELLCIYIPLLSKDNSDDAEDLLQSALDKNFDPKLLHLYGQLESTHQDKQLKVAENYLKKYPENAALLLTLARLCVKNKLWGKARSYFEASLSISASVDVYSELGQLFEKLNEPQKAMEYYRQGLMLKLADENK